MAILAILKLIANNNMVKYLAWLWPVLLTWSYEAKKCTLSIYDDNSQILSEPRDGNNPKDFNANVNTKVIAV